MIKMKLQMPVEGWKSPDTASKGHHVAESDDDVGEGTVPQVPKLWKKASHWKVSSLREVTPDTPVTPPNDRVSSSRHGPVTSHIEVTPEERPLLPLVFTNKTKIAILEKKLKSKSVKLAALRARAQQQLVAQARAQQLAAQARGTATTRCNIL